MGEVHLGLVLPQKQHVWVQAFQWQAKTVGRAHGLKIRVSHVTDFSCLDGFSLVIAKTSELLARGDEERLAALRALDPARLLDPFEAVAVINDRFALAAALGSLEVRSSSCVSSLLSSLYPLFCRCAARAGRRVWRCRRGSCGTASDWPSGRPSRCRGCASPRRPMAARPRTSWCWRTAKRVWASSCAEDSGRCSPLWPTKAAS